MPSITGQSIAIIGGSSGIGFGVAKLALKEGVRVAIISSNPTRIESAIANLKKEAPGSQITGYECDLKAQDVEARLEKVFTEIVTANDGNSLDHVIFTAGDQLAVKPLEEIDINFIREAGQVRFVAPLLVAKLAPRFVKNNYSSSLILTTGAMYQKPGPHRAIAASYFAGLHAMTRNLAIDLKPIRVNLVSPGAVNTELWGPDRESLIAQFSKTAFMGRVATAEEVAESYVYLMKDTNSTGSTVSTNGGVLL